MDKRRKKNRVKKVEKHKTKEKGNLGLKIISCSY
jgi:hypothetical protein